MEPRMEPRMGHCGLAGTMTDDLDLPDDPAVRALARAARVHRTPCGDGHVVWRVWGADDAPPLLLLHGGSGSWMHWVRNLAPLRDDGWRLLVPDLPGFGESAAPPDAEDADGMPQALAPGLRELAGHAPVPAVTFSFGGLVAACWAQEEPQRFSQLVLVGAPALPAGEAPILPLRPWLGIADGAARDAVHRHNLHQLMLADQASIDPLAVAIHGLNLQRDRMRRRRMMRIGALARMLPTLTMPLHGIWGARDALSLGREALVEAALRSAPGFQSMTWVPEAGHWLPYERPTAFHDALRTVLGAAPNPPAPRIAPSSIR